MKNKFFTVLVVRHARPKFRKFQMSYSFAAVTTVLAVALLLAGLFAPSLLFQVRSQTVALDRLQHENRLLASEKDYFEGALAQMSDRLGAFEDQAGRIARELGLEEPIEGGAGGPADGVSAPPRFPFESEVRGLQTRTETLDRSFEKLDSVFQERMRVLASTPSQMPTQGWFSHGYGWREDPFSGKRQFHRGIDIVAESGTDIVAPADGVVARSGRFSDYGKSIDLNHGYGYVTRYAHMSDVLVRSGDRVNRGDVIGRVGSTGRSTGPHLHYEVFRDGRRVNPWKYLGK